MIPRKGFVIFSQDAVIETVHPLSAGGVGIPNNSKHSVDRELSVGNTAAPACPEVQYPHLQTIDVNLNSNMDRVRA